MTPLPHANKRWFAPITLKTNVAFVLIATLFLALVGWLMQVGIAPSFAATALSQRYSPWNTIVPLRIWMQLAVILALILPMLALLIWWRWGVVRRLLLLYVGVLLVQIPTEMIFSRLGLTGMNYVIGFTYTSYRVWQLWCYARFINNQARPSPSGWYIVVLIFLSGLIFWALNWLFLAINLVTRTVGA